MIFISKTLVRSRHVQLYNLDQFSIFKSISTCTIDPNQPSFQVSYLIKSCGLSPKSALKVSKLVKFENPEKPDSAIAFFKKHGFSETQVSRLVMGLPQLITSNTEKTILPKLQFFYSKGISVPDVAKMLSRHPDVLKRSLVNQLIPTFEFFTKFLRSEDKTVHAIKRLPRVLAYDFHRTIVPIIDIFRRYGVPESNIMMMLSYQPGGFIMNSEKLTEIIEEVMKMGFDPLKVTFVIAIHALRSMTKPTWERKVEVYKRWGWSDEDILQAFRQHPWCMTYSEETINAKIDFFINKMGWDPSVVVRRPQYLAFSLERRIIPRCRVLVELLSKGLIKEKYGVTTLLGSTDKFFLQKYVNCYKDEAPRLLKIYHGKRVGLKEREATE